MALQDLDKRLEQACALFNREASAMLKIEFVSRYNRRDQMRLLNLITWSKRYKIPYSLVFQTILNYWRQKFKAHTYPGRLGVKPSTIAGKISRDIVERFVLTQYPDDENEAIWRDNAARRIVAKLGSKDAEYDTSKGFKDPTTYVAQYKKHIARQQERMKHVAHRMSRRPFRNNPFLA